MISARQSLLTDFPGLIALDAISMLEPPAKSLPIAEDAETAEKFGQFRGKMTLNPLFFFFCVLCRSLR